MNIKEQLDELKSQKVFPVIVDGVDNLYVKRMSARETIEFNENVEKYNSHTQFGAALLAATCCDADGKLIFDESEIDQILDYPNYVINAIALKAQEVNYMTNESREKLKKS